MAAPTPPFVAHCIELLETLGPVRARRMFGGWGFYVDDCMLALIAFERLYLKVNAGTQPRFAAAGCEQFVYHGKGQPVTMSYWTAPADALESPALMLPWARLALQAALAARAAAAPATPTRPRPAAKPAMRSKSKSTKAPARGR
jgi:DNA transformation protein and related proteins